MCNEVNRQERYLRILLRVGGVTMLLATLAIFMPTSWMAATHQWLGMGPFPASPLTDYLTRSASFLYAMHGGLLLVLATDVRRYRKVLLYLGLVTALGGALLTGIDLHAGMPTWWTLSEGPPVTLLGCLMVWLVQRVPGHDEASH